MIVSLPFPHKLLWPNGSRGSYRAVAGEKKKHRKWAWAETLSKVKHGSPVEMPRKLIVYPKAKGPLPDKDNCISACKAYLDGIADALGLNDQAFPVLEVEFSEDRTGRFEIEVRAI